MHRVLASAVLMLVPTVAFANCPATMDPTSRLNCLNRSINDAATIIASLQAENAALETRLGDAEASLEIQDGDIAALFTASTNTDASFATLESNVHNLAVDVDSLTSSLDTLGLIDLGDLFTYLTVDTATNSIVFSGANVYVQNGSGATDGAVNGLGNLVVGYDEDLMLAWGAPASDRTGSHNLVVGMGHSYSSYGGLVSGTVNSVHAPDAAVIGGYGNAASGMNSAIVAGQANSAAGDYSATLGGSNNSANGTYATVAGGELNVAEGDWSSILGGQWLSVTEDYETSPSGEGGGGGDPDVADLLTYLSVDTATNSVIFSGANVYVRNGTGNTYDINGLGNLIVGYDENAADLGGDPSDKSGSHNLIIGMGHSYASYGGLVAGLMNTLSGPESSVTGGSFNEAAADGSVVAGGVGNRASGIASAVLGGSSNTASAYYATVSGGFAGYATGQWSSILGGQYNNADGTASSVSGGGNNVAGGTFSAILGGYVQTTGEDYETWPE